MAVTDERTLADEQADEHLTSVDATERERATASAVQSATSMRVRKRNGALEPVDVNKIVNAVARATEGLLGVDPMIVSTRTIAALADGATTQELDELSIRTAAGLIVEEPNYSKLAARLLSTYIDKEVRNQNVPWFSESVALGHSLGIIGDDVLAFVNAHAPTLNAAIDSQRDRRFEFFGLRTVYDRYLLRHPETRHVLETPQYFFLRVACGLSTHPDEAIRFYDLMSSLAYLPSSPTLFNSGTTHPQMSSCYLLDSPEDSLEGIYKRYTDIAQLSKFAGGIGVAWHRIRSKNSLIVGTNGLSNGIVPWLKTLDASVAAVNQGGRRKGAACVYLESWHADIDQFLELRDNTGDAARRTHNINLANWIPDLFMERVEKDWQWSLFDPKQVPELIDTYGDEFRQIYEQAEADGRYEKQVPARQLYQRMMKTLAETGNGWMTFKDSSNAKCNQTGPGTAPAGGESAANGAPVNARDRVVHLSNLCTEILEVTSQDETAVCNLGSVNLGEFIETTVDGVNAVDYRRLGEVVRQVVPFLDRVIDINYYPTDRGLELQQPVAPRGPRPDGPAGRVLPDGSAVRLPGRTRRVAAHQRGDLLQRPVGVDRARRGPRPPRRVRRDPRGRRAISSSTCGASSRPTQAIAGLSASRPHRAARAPQLADDRHRPHGHDRLDRRLLRVHRAPGLQPLQARDPVG